MPIEEVLARRLRIVTDGLKGGLHLSHQKAIDELEAAFRDLESMASIELPLSLKGVLDKGGSVTQLTVPAERYNEERMTVHLETRTRSNQGGSVQKDIDVYPQVPLWDPYQGNGAGKRQALKMRLTIIAEPIVEEVKA